MGEVVQSRDCIEATIPVFPVARINNDILDEFFSVSDAACKYCEYEKSQSTLMHSQDISTIKPRTEAPIQDDLIQTWPFAQYTPSHIIRFARQNLNMTDFSPTNMVVLDERTNEDKTCLLLSLNELGDDGYDFVQVRSDFESSVVSLRTIETGCGGTDHLDTDYVGSDGILKISVRDRGQK